MIYDYIFFKSYQLGVKSKNFEGTPVLSGLMWLAPVLLFNALALNSLISYMFKIKYVHHSRNYGFIIAIVLFIALSLYYRRRFARIIDKYEAAEREKGKSMHPLIVVISSFIISLCIMFAAASLPKS